MQSISERACDMCRESCYSTEELIAVLRCDPSSDCDNCPANGRKDCHSINVRKQAADRLEILSAIAASNTRASGRRRKHDRS